MYLYLMPYRFLLLIGRIFKICLVNTTYVSVVNVIVDGAITFVRDDHRHEDGHGQRDSNHGVQKVGVDEFQVVADDEIESARRIRIAYRIFICVEKAYYHQ